MLKFTVTSKPPSVCCTDSPLDNLSGIVARGGDGVGGDLADKSGYRRDRVRF